MPSRHWYGTGEGWAYPENAHSWMCLYAVSSRKSLKKGEGSRQEPKKFLVRCKDIKWAQQRLNNTYTRLGAYEGGSHKLNHFLMTIDGIEYTLDPTNTVSITDALGLHEAFYDKEYQEGLKKESDQKKKIKNESIVLKGLSTSKKRKANGEYVQYNRALTLEKIAIWIASQQTITQMVETHDFSNLELHMPDECVIRLPDFAIDSKEIPFDRFSHSWYYSIFEDKPRGSWVMKQVNEWIKPQLENAIARSKKEREKGMLQIVGKNLRSFKLASLVQ